MTTIKGYHISDIHYDDKNYATLEYELKNIFYDDIKNNINDIDYITFNGDYFHKKLQLNSPAAISAINFLNDLMSLVGPKGIKVRMLLGTKSHDFDQLQNFKSLENKYDFKIINTVQEEELFPNFFVLYLPEEYMKDQDVYYQEFLGDELEDDYYDMIFFHGTFEFAAFESQKQEAERQISNAPIYDAKKMSRLCAGNIIGGHIHRHQTYQKVVYTGSYSANSFDETGAHGYISTIYNQDDMTCEWTLIENTLKPEYLTLSNDDEFHDLTVVEKINQVKALRDEADFVRFKIDNTCFVSSTDLLTFREAISRFNNINLIIVNKAEVKYNSLTKELEIDEEEKEESPFKFIKENNSDKFTIIKEFIATKYDVELDIEVIKEIILED